MVRSTAVSCCSIVGSGEAGLPSESHRGSSQTPIDLRCHSFGPTPHHPYRHRTTPECQPLSTNTAVLLEPCRTLKASSASRRFGVVLFRLKERADPANLRCCCGPTSSKIQNTPLAWVGQRASTRDEPLSGTSFRRVRTNMYTLRRYRVTALEPASDGNGIVARSSFVERRDDSTWHREKKKLTVSRTYPPI